MVFPQTPLDVHVEMKLPTWTQVPEELELVAGGRRVAAAAQLGWLDVPVTVVDLATAAETLRAEADENTCRKPLTPFEASRARERRARLLAPKAAERKGGRGKTSSNLDEVSTARATRKVAATGTGYSGSTLDKVDKIRDVRLHDDLRRGMTVASGAESGCG